MLTARVLLVLTIVWVGGSAGCNRPPAPSAPSASSTQPPSQQADPVLRARKEKDLAFRNDRSSPLRDEDKARFVGLDYYPVNPQYRFRVTLQRYPAPTNLRLGTNTGEQRDSLRYGYFEFSVSGQTCRLQVYKVMDSLEGTGNQLFLPFRDSTSGKETYGGGRYIDLQENTTGIYDLDFNLAYNPTCAYGRNFSCPLPPRENTLPVPIPAGEKTFSVK